MHLSIKIFLTTSLILLISFSISIPALSEADLRDELIVAFEAVREAEKVNADITNLVKELNEVLILVQENEQTDNKETIEKGNQKIHQIITSAYEIRNKGIQESRKGNYATLLTLGLLSAALIPTYIYIPRIYWRIWMRMKYRMRINKR